MGKRPRRNHSPASKAKVATTAGKGEKTFTELSRQFDVDPNPINQWQAKLLESAADVSRAEQAPVEPAVDVTVLRAKIADPAWGVLELVPGIAAIGEDVPQPGERCRISAGTNGTPSRSCNRRCGSRRAPDCLGYR